MLFSWIGQNSPKRRPRLDKKNGFIMLLLVKKFMGESVASIPVSALETDSPRDETLQSTTIVLRTCTYT